MKARELREKSTEELEEQLKELEREIFNLRYQKYTSEQRGGLHRIRNLRKDIARIKTILREREILKEEENGKK